MWLAVGQGGTVHNSLALLGQHNAYRCTGVLVLHWQYTALPAFGWFLLQALVQQACYLSTVVSPNLLTGACMTHLTASHACSSACFSIWKSVRTGSRKARKPATMTPVSLSTRPDSRL